MTLDFKNEWKESQERLDVIAGERLDELVDALGGAAFLATISRAHRAYGEALLIAPSGRTEEPDAPVRASLAATHLALRDYVAKVAATAQRQDEESVAVATALLAPISARACAEEIDDTFVSAHE